METPNSLNRLKSSKLPSVLPICIFSPAQCNQPTPRLHILLRRHAPSCRTLHIKSCLPNSEENSAWTPASKCHAIVRPAFRFFLYFHLLLFFVTTLTRRFCQMTGAAPQRDLPSAIHFYDLYAAFGEFGNFYPAPFMAKMGECPQLSPQATTEDAVDGDEWKQWPTSEHYFQAAKFLPHRPDIAEAIRLAERPRFAFNIAHANHANERADWLAIREQVCALDSLDCAYPFYCCFFILIAGSVRTFVLACRRFSSFQSF